MICDYCDRLREVDRGCTCMMLARCFRHQHPQDFPDGGEPPREPESAVWVELSATRRGPDNMGEEPQYRTQEYLPDEPPREVVVETAPPPDYWAMYEG